MRRTLTGMGLLLAAGVMAAPAAAQQPVEMTLCTGSPGKTYARVGQTLAEIAPEFTMGALTIKPVPSQGSLDNIAKALDGTCDAFITQADALLFAEAELPRATPDAFEVIGELYKELGILICHEDAGFDNLKHAGSAPIGAGTMGSGSFATLYVLKKNRPEQYGNVRVLPFNGFQGALKVVGGEAACVFDVIAPQSDYLTVLDTDAKTRDVLDIAELDDQALEDITIGEQKVYEQVTFDDEIYDNISVTGDPETIAISALLVASRTFAEAHPQALSTLSMLLMMGGADIRATAYGESGAPPFK